MRRLSLILNKIICLPWSPYFACTDLPHTEPSEPSQNPSDGLLWGWFWRGRKTSRNGPFLAMWGAVRRVEIEFLLRMDQILVALGMGIYLTGPPTSWVQWGYGYFSKGGGVVSRILYGNFRRLWENCPLLLLRNSPMVSSGEYIVSTEQKRVTAIKP